MTRANYNSVVSFALLAAIACIGSAAAQDRPVKVGILNDQASVYSAITGPGSVAAARLAIEDMGGSLFGKPIELVSADHGHKPDLGSAIARRWFDTEGVDAIFDIYSSGVALAVQGIAEQKNKLLVVSMASSRDISGKSCSPNGMQWANDGYEVANLTIKGSSGDKPTSWFFLTVDYTAGHSIEGDAKKMIEKSGGKFVGAVRFPLNTPDFSSFLLQAQNSGAKNIGFIGGGADMTNAIKQAAEFGIDRTGQRLVPFSLTTVDVESLGNEATQGMPLVLSYYWDASDQTKAWAERFKKAFGKMPSDPQANVYSAVLHYLKSVKAAGTTDTAAVVAKMREMPVEDLFTSGAHIREDGRLMRDVYYAEVKKPDAMSGSTDLITLVKKMAGSEAFIPASESDCKLLKK
jgi:branched-chain amino acid transport system substrate-binding protein